MMKDKKHKENKKLKILKCIIIITLFVTAIYLLNKNNIFKNYSVEDIKEYINSYGNLAPIVFIIMFTLVPLTLFPDAVLALAGGMIFGLYKGFIFIMIGAICGATLSFYISRFLGKGSISKFIKKDINCFKNGIEKKGFLIILLLRLIPLLPFDVISYGAGITKIKYKDFICATALGIIPGVLIYANLGEKSSTFGSSDFYIAVSLLILLFISSYFLKKKLSLKQLQQSE